MALNRFYRTISIFIIPFLLVFHVPSARADVLADAIEAVKKASDTELLAELQRRHQSKRDGSPSEGTRGIEAGLRRFDDAILVRAIRLALGKSRVIYGLDDRKDWHEIEDETIKRIASASIAMFRSEDLKLDASGSATLISRTLGEVQRLCEGETFAEQITGAFCSATLVRRNVALTAGHCIREVSNNTALPNIAATSFVFGYRVEMPDSPGVTAFPRSQIFQGKQVLGGELAKGEGADWALVELDRPVPADIAEPISSWRLEPVAKDQSVFVIGHPSGLPLKYASAATVRDVSAEEYFTANLDTFGGNSGSGVYDAATNELAGVLVRGETDYVNDDAAGCARVNICPSSGCRGEDVMRISFVPKP